jgi:hypothetical protein
MDDKVSVTAASDDDWEHLLSFLPHEWEEKCRELGAMKRFREFSGAQILLRTLLIHLLDGCSLRETSVRARLGKFADVSDVALLKRLNLAGEWFQWMAGELLRTWTRNGESLKGKFGSRPLRAVDATCVSEPGSTGTVWRIHYSFDLDKLECTEFQLSDHTIGETFKNFTIEAGALYAADRGYYHPEGIHHVVAGQGDVLVRMTVSGPALYDADGKTFNLLKHLRRLKGAHIGDWPVRFTSQQGAVVRGRVCAIKKSAVAAQHAIEKIFREHSKKQKTPSKEAIEGAKYVFVFTTVSADELPAVNVLDFYRHRWQIELVFKRMKSILGLGHLPKQDPGGAKAWIHGKLFCAVLIEVLDRAADRFSPWGYPLQAQPT